MGGVEEFVGGVGGVEECVGGVEECCGRGAHMYYTLHILYCNYTHVGPH